MCMQFHVIVKRSTHTHTCCNRMRMRPCTEFSSLNCIRCINDKTGADRNIEMLLQIAIFSLSLSDSLSIFLLLGMDSRVLCIRYTCMQTDVHTKFWAHITSRPCVYLKYCV